MTQPVSSTAARTSGAGRPVTVILLALVAIAAMAAGLWFGKPAATYQTLKLYPEAKPIADFALVNQHGESLGIRDLHGRWHLLFFGFTHCPDICPATLAQLAQVMQNLRGALPEHLLPRTLFISVDPDRDDPEQLARYVNYFDPNFIAATGPDAQLRALSMQLGVIYAIESHQPGDQQYNVDHSAAVLLMDPEARLRGLFPAPHDPDRLTADLKRLLQRNAGR